jgi:uncharacterized membrane protein YbjE (DUF340 family)
MPAVCGVPVMLKKRLGRVQPAGLQRGQRMGAGLSRAGRAQVGRSSAAPPLVAWSCMGILESLLPIGLSLVGGYAMGRLLPVVWTRVLGRAIIPLIWGLLFLVGFEFGAVLSSAQAIAEVMKTAAIFALATTVLPGLLIVLSRGRRPGAARPQAGRFSMQQIWTPLRGCATALFVVLLGCAVFVLQQAIASDLRLMPSSHALLLLLIVLVGIDLSQVRLEPRWFSKAMLAVPLWVVVGSLVGGALAAWLTGVGLRTALALASGYGWFTLSSVLIGNALGQTLGTVALMTDLLRELLAIGVIYALGRREPQLSIGSAGATALDSTLPIIRQACGTDAVPLALFSGFLLTLIAPVLITLILR